MRRRLQYWRILDDRNEPVVDGEQWRIVRALKKARSEGVDRHWVCRNGMTILAHPVKKAPSPTLILDRVRTGNYPSAGDPLGNRRRIPLADGEVLLEPTYVMFLQGGIVAALVGGDGPHPQRLAEYLRRKLGLRWYLEPVLRDDLDAVLQEMRVTELQVSIPAHLVTRELVGGGWYEALLSGSKLVDDGVVRIGMSVGRHGDRKFKDRISDTMKQRARELRQAAGFEHFASARVAGVRHGDPQVLDLLEDRLVQSVEVDEDRWFDPEESERYAVKILTQVVKEGQFAEGFVAKGDGKLPDLKVGEARSDDPK